MLVAPVLKNLLWALRYPSFVSPTNLAGEYPVGAVQTRIPSTSNLPSIAVQIHYPAVPGQGEEGVPYFRPQAVQGLAEYTRQSASILEFLSHRSHPCHMNAPPISHQKKFPIVVFSHGLGGCMEMYTELCQQIASQGYWVVAMEHGDGSGAYAETLEGKPIYYKRPDDTPYSRAKVVNFRRPFLEQRVQEIQSLLEYILDESKTCKNERLEQVFAAADTSQGVHMVGHSFGGATMVVASQDATLKSQIQSVSVLDCWAFSLEDAVLERGLEVPTLSVLSEAWLTNPEVAQVQQLLRNSTSVEHSYSIPKSVHSSFSDSTHWLPGVVTRRMGLRAPKERKHDTIRTAARACVAHIQQQMRQDETTTNTIPTLLQQGELVEFQVGATKSSIATEIVA